MCAILKHMLYLFTFGAHGKLLPHYVFYVFACFSVFRYKVCSIKNFLFPAPPKAFIRFIIFFVIFAPARKRRQRQPSKPRNEFYYIRQLRRTAAGSLVQRELSTLLTEGLFYFIIDIFANAEKVRVNFRVRYSYNL